jgi:ABC-type phosphonate transport system ATPase subunit
VTGQQPLLQVRHAGDRYGCRDVDFELRPGEVRA